MKITFIIPKWHHMQESPEWHQTTANEILNATAIDWLLIYFVYINYIFWTGLSIISFHLRQNKRLYSIVKEKGGKQKKQQHCAPIRLGFTIIWPSSSSPHLCVYILNCTNYKMLSAITERKLWPEHYKMNEIRSTGARTHS